MLIVVCVWRLNSLVSTAVTSCLIYFSFSSYLCCTTSAIHGMCGMVMCSSHSVQRFSESSDSLSQSLPPIHGTQSNWRRERFHCSFALTFVFLVCVCAVAVLFLPAVEGKGGSSLPDYLHVSLQAKLVAAFVLGKSMNRWREGLISEMHFISSDVYTFTIIHNDIISSYSPCRNGDHVCYQNRLTCVCL